MITRLFTDPEEWEVALRGTPLHCVADTLPAGTPAMPSGSVVIVVEDAGEVVGTWAVVPYHHLEGVWVAPEHRGKAAVAKHLVNAAMYILQGRQQTVALTASDSPSVDRIIRHMGGTELPARHFVLPVRT